MKYKQMTASVRDARGTKATRQLRREGKLPGVLYGGKTNDGGVNHEVEALTLSQKDFQTVVHGGYKFIDVEVDGKVTNTVIKDLQWDAWDDSILHFDLQRIDLNEKVTVNVPFVFKGISKGERKGGKLNKVLQEASVSGLPRELPEFVEVRVDNIDAGEGLRVSDIALPKGVEWITDGEHLVVEAKIKRAAVETTETEEGAEGGAAEGEAAAE